MRSNKSAIKEFPQLFLQRCRSCLRLRRPYACDVLFVDFKLTSEAHSSHSLGACNFSPLLIVGAWVVREVKLQLMDTKRYIGFIIVIYNTQPNMFSFAKGPFPELRVNLKKLVLADSWSYTCSFLQSSQIRNEFQN